MRYFVAFFLSFVVHSVHAKNSDIFELSVEKVVESTRLTITGTHIVGNVVSGCIRKGDALEIYRGNRKLGEEKARVVDVPGKLKPEAEEGERARIYVSTKLGLGFDSADKLISENTSCSDL